MLTKSAEHSDPQKEKQDITFTVVSMLTKSAEHSDTTEEKLLK